MRCLYHCDKIPSGEKINRSSLRKLLKENSINAPDIEDIVPFIPGVKRGKPVMFKKYFIQNNSPFILTFDKKKYVHPNFGIMNSDGFG